MLLKLSKFFLYVSVFSVLVVMTSAFFPFIGGKDYFFRTSIQLALVFLILWWGFEAKTGEFWSRCREMFRRPLFVAVSLFVLMFMLATLFAVNQRAAFWSNYERGEGGFQMLHYYAFFFMLVFLFRDRKDWERMLWVSVAAGVGMILYGVGAAVFVVNPESGAFYNPFSFVGPYVENGKLTAGTFLGRIFSKVRFQGSLGNPAYVAPYLMFSIFYLLWLWISDKAKTFSKNLLYGLIAFFFVVFFFLSGTRGAFIGLVAATFAFLFALAVGYPRFRKWMIATIAGFTVVLGILFYYNNSSFVKSLPMSRLFNIDFSERTLQTRLWTWNSAWQGFKERPVLGWGPENFSAVFDKYFDPRHFIPGKQSETWFDYAHSVIFDYLAETGILGLLSFLGIFAVFFWELGKRWNAESRVINALIASIVVSYLVQGLALFNVLPMYINIFLFAAFACYLFYYNKKESPASA